MAYRLFLDSVKRRINEKTLGAVFSNSGVGIAIHDENNIYLKVNEKFLQILGYKKEDLIGKSLHSITYDEDRPIGFAGFENLNEHPEKALVLEKRYIHKNGHTVWCRVTVTPYASFQSDRDSTNGFISIIEDISDQKKTEAMNQEIQLQLVSSAKMSELGRMASGVAHEINNPLSTISGAIGVLKKDFEKSVMQGGDPDKLSQTKKYLEIMDKNILRISKIIRGLRLFSRSAEKDPFEPADARIILEDTLELCREIAKYRSIQLNVQLMTEKSLIFDCRPTEISQVLLNLINNGMDAIEKLEDRWIDVSIDSREDKIFFTVTDSGSGIPPEIAEKILQPFFTTKDVGKGTGLGLSISVGIVESHHGSLWYNKNSPHTQFVFSIPMSQKNIRNQNINVDEVVSLHIHWRKEIQKMLSNAHSNEKIIEIPDCYNCELGKWIEFQKSKAGFTQEEYLILHSLAVAHQKFHENAELLIKQVTQNEFYATNVEFLNSKKEFESNSYLVVTLLLRMKNKKVA